MGISFVSSHEAKKTQTCISLPEGMENMRYPLQSNYYPLSILCHWHPILSQTTIYTMVWLQKIFAGTRVDFSIDLQNTWTRDSSPNH